MKKIKINKRVFINLFLCFKKKFKFLLLNIKIKNNEKE